MTSIFQNLLTASFYGSIIIAVVLLLRLLLSRAPKRAVCILWMLAFIRLLMPFQLESTLSLQPEVVPLEETTFYEAVTENTEPDAMLPVSTHEIILNDTAEDADHHATASNGNGEVIVQSEPPPPPVHWTSMLPYLWMVGATSCLLYALVSYIQLKRTVREAVKIIGCWECDRIETAFILGYIRPRIYVPMGLSRKMRRHILAHEWAHLKTGDHWFKLLAYLACCLHWFNPFVWVAYRFMCKDMEHACDERVVKYMNLESRKQYSHALLTCSTNHSHYTPCPVAFGEISVKTRILSVLNYRKPSFWITLIAVIAVIAVVVFLMTSPTSLISSNNALPDEMMELADAVHEDPYFADSEIKQFKKLLDKLEKEPLTIPEVSKTVTVSNVDELLLALAPDTEIILMPGTYNLWEAANYGNKDEGQPYYDWGNGNQLELYNLKNIILSGSGKGETTILAEPSEADVLLLKSCSNIYLKGITFGHATPPIQYSCTGYAVSMRACMNVMMEDLGLYGCGVVGLYADFCHNLSITDSDIYDCSNTGIVLRNTNYADISKCKLYDIGTTQNKAISIISVFDSIDVKFLGCQIYNNYCQNLLSCNNSDVVFKGNTFIDNHISDGAFWFAECSPTFSNSSFAHNELLNWYYIFSDPAVGIHGEELTENDFNGIHVKVEKPTGNQTKIYVSTVDEFLQAIAPDTEIILKNELYDLSKATGYGTINGEYDYWNPVYDGYELVITNVNNMSIYSLDNKMDKHTITAFPRYANVLRFQYCSNINLAGFTAGHTETGAACGGGVIYIDSSEQFNIQNCGLFGCGTIGIDANSSRDLKVTNCDIYECTVGGIFTHKVSDMEIKNTTFRDLGGYNGMGGYIIAPIECSNITMDGKEVTDRIEYTGNISVTDFELTYNGESVNNITEPIGTFLKIVPEGLPEGSQVTWTQDNPYVLSFVPHTNHCQVQLVGLGTANLTASFNGIKKSITIFSTNDAAGAIDSNAYALAYFGTPLTEFSVAVGDTTEIEAINLPSKVGQIIWATDNPEAVNLITDKENFCTIEAIGTGTANVTAYCDGHFAAVTVYIREAW